MPYRAPRSKPADPFGTAQGQSDREHQADDVAQERNLRDRVTLGQCLDAGIENGQRGDRRNHIEDGLARRDAQSWALQRRLDSAFRFCRQQNTVPPPDRELTRQTWAEHTELRMIPGRRPIPITTQILLASVFLLGPSLAVATALATPGIIASALADEALFFARYANHFLANGTFSFNPGAAPSFGSTSQL